ncbi:hypothetical protein [Paucibacter soli]|uniref:hypothetical protein n=1 Tax=Paucibacter soli TaxID=3133433 RepID=UPI0030A69AA9
MKVQEIQVGRTYHDGKAGLRKVVARDGSPLKVRYVILAAKVEREMDQNYEYVSVIGQESACDLESFARWAKSGYDDAQAQGLLVSLQAAKIKLSPGEAAFMASALKEAEGKALAAGSTVSYNHTEGRAVSGLEKKGMLRRVSSSEVEVLAHGAARLAAMAVS